MTIEYMAEPHWIDETDWLCAVEFLNDEDPEGRDLAADTIGYLLGYAHLTNTRSLALVGDPEMMAYEILFSFPSPSERKMFLDLIRSNDELGPVNTIRASSVARENRARRGGVRSA